MILPDLLASRAALGPGRIAIEALEGGGATSYRALDVLAGRYAALIARRGAGDGARVALLARNRVEVFALLFACARAGAVLVPLNWRLAAPELDAVAADCEPAIVFVDRALAGRARGLAGAATVIDLDDPAHLDGIDPAPPRARRSDETWYLLHTSGTTGRPKGVIQTFGAAIANHVNVAGAIGLGADEVTLSVLPTFHTAGLNLYALPTLLAGGRVILGTFEVERVAAVLAEGRVTSMFGVPTIYQALAEHPRFAGIGGAPLRMLGCGGAPLPDALAARYLAAGLPLCNGMGMTETGPTAFVMDPAGAAARIGSVGRAQLLVEARIVADGRDVAPGAVGEIWYRGPAVTPGYWRQPEATAAAFAPGGWFRSGDLGRRDADGYVWVAGRLTDMFISGGENVHPAEVEAVLARAPGVREAAVVGIADARWGETGCAFVVADEVDEAALAAHCAASLAGYKVPRAFRFLDALPRTASGKVERRLLSRWAAAPCTAAHAAA